MHYRAGARMDAGWPAASSAWTQPRSDCHRRCQTPAGPCRYSWRHTGSRGSGCRRLPRHAAQRRSTSPVLERCFDDGRLALDNNLAAPALRCVAIGRQNDLLAGSDTGGHRVMYSLIETAELNGLDHSYTSPTCLFAPAIIQPGVSPNCFPGTGSLPTPARAAAY